MILTKAGAIICLLTIIFIRKGLQKNCKVEVNIEDKRYCLYEGTKSIWDDVVSTCHRLEAQSTFFEQLFNPQLYEQVQKHIPLFAGSTYWIQAKRDSLNKQIRLNLMTSCTFQRRLYESFSNSSFWFHDKPSLEGNESCVVVEIIRDPVLVLSNTPSTFIRARMADCQNEYHNFVCMIPAPYTYYSNFYDNRNEKNERSSCDISRQPYLNLRDDEVYDLVLEVYFPGELWRPPDAYVLNKNINQYSYCNSTTNPVCYVQGADVYNEYLLQLQLINNHSWNATSPFSGKISDNYLFTKFEFAVLMNTNGLVVCQALTKNKQDVISATRTVIRNDTFTYVVNTTFITNNCSGFICEPTFNIYYWIDAIKSLSFGFKIQNKIFPAETSLVAVYGISPDTVSVHLHVTASNTNLLADIKQNIGNVTYEKLIDRYLLNSIVTTTSRHDHNMTMRSTRYCMPVRSVCNNKTFTWHTTRVGEIGFTKELCVGENDNPCSRVCHVNFIHGAFWEQKELTKCESNNITALPQLQVLYNTSNLSSEQILDMLYSTVTGLAGRGEFSDTLTPVDLRILSRMFYKISRSVRNFTNTEVHKLANVVDGIMRTLPSSQSKETMESCENIIGSVDKILNSVELKESSKLLVVTPRFSTLIIDSTAHQRNWVKIVGIAYISVSKEEEREYENEYTMFDEKNIQPLREDESMSDILDKGPEIAIVIPPYILNEQKAVYSMYWDQSMFGTIRNTQGGHVIQATVNGKNYNNLNPAVQIIFKRKLNDTKDGKCVFWDTSGKGTFGAWSSEGCTFSPWLPSDADICVCTHLTHFSQLLYDRREAKITDPSNVRRLSIITIVGCSLSLLGLMGIAITAIVFPGSRKGALNKVFFNVFIAIAILMSLVLFESIIYSEKPLYVPCVIIGVLTHYSVLAVFCWMIVAAYMQYIRLVNVFSSILHTSHLVIKSSIIGWVLPLLPCSILLIINIDIYGPSNLCYPKQEALYYGVFFPVTIAVACNVIIFLLIVRSLFLSTASIETHVSETKKKKDIIRKVMKLGFLFVLFGLSWIFGILGFQYLFCITASLQGLALFVFHVILDENTRHQWMKAYSRLKHRKNDKGSATLTMSDM